MVSQSDSNPIIHIILQLVGSSIAAIILIVILSVSINPLPPLGPLLDPQSGLWHDISNSELPSNEVSLVNGLNEEVSIYRDEWGVPHIYSQTDSDAFFTIGYVHAQDRLFQLEMQRRLAYGELAEIIGESAISTDILLRTIGIGRIAHDSWDYYLRNAPDAPYIEGIKAYSLGINAYLEKLAPADYPIEFRLLNIVPRIWIPENTLSIGLLMAFGLSWDPYDLLVAVLEEHMGETVVNELFPVNNTYNQIPVIPDYGNFDGASSSPFNGFQPNSSIPSDLFPHFTNFLTELDRVDKLKVLNYPVGEFPKTIGSNNWVISGNKSSTGYPLLANDMHLSHSLPPIWYEVHYHSLESEANVYGFTLAGAPTVVVGHNDYVAWGLTNSQGDFTDYYYYLLDPSDPSRFLNKNNYSSFRTIEENIQVKGGNNRQITVQFVQQDGVMCPVLPIELIGYSDVFDSRYPSCAIVMRWTAFKIPFTTVEAMYQFNTMNNLTEFLSVAEKWSSPGSVCVFADIYGNIAMKVIGDFPNRTNGSLGRLPANGSASEGIWSGYIPLNDIPSSVNPSQGYLASANQRIAGPMYTTQLSSFHASGYRARRINEILNGTGSGKEGKFTVEDFKDAQADIIDTFARNMVPFLLSNLLDSNHKLVNEARIHLENWDYVMGKDLVAPLIWHFWLEYFIQFTLSDDYEQSGISWGSFPEPLMNIIEEITLNNITKWFDDTTTPDISETLSDIATKALLIAIEDLETLFGSEINTKWRWGEFHQLDIQHLTELTPFNAPLYSWEGTAYTLNAAGGSTRVTGGPSERAIFDLGKLRERTVENISHSYIAQLCIAGGQRGWFMSRHYRDQLEKLWLNYDYHNAWFASSEEKLRLISEQSFKIESTLTLQPKGGY